MNPRAGFPTCTLSRGVPSASLGTSPQEVSLLEFNQFPDFHSNEIIFLKKVKKINGEGGIRTHAPLRTNGFQDRLVMTTSIPLRIQLRVCFNASVILTSHFLYVNIFFYFFIAELLLMQTALPSANLPAW